MSGNRDRGRNEPTWTIVLYLKGFARLPEISFLNFCVLSRSQVIRTERIVLESHLKSRRYTYIVKIARGKDVTESEKGDCLVSTDHEVVVC